MTKILIVALACCGNDMGVSPWLQMPPAQYDHAYKGRLVMHYLNSKQMFAVCGAFARACSKPHGGSCEIFLPQPTPAGAPQIYEALRRHEIAHCNGWRH